MSTEKKKAPPEVLGTVLWRQCNDNQERSQTHTRQVNSDKRETGIYKGHRLVWDKTVVFLLESQQWHYQSE